MRRRDGVLLVLGLWAFMGFLVLMALWPLIFIPVAMVGLFLMMLFAAIFVWPYEDEL